MALAPAPATSAVAPDQRRPARAGLVVVAVLAVLVTAASPATYAVSDLETMAENGLGLATTYVAVPVPVQVALYVHIASSSIALLLGPLQFSQRLRRRRPALHRATGRVYLGAVGVGALSAVIMLPTNFGGMVGFFGFGTLAVLWVLAAVRAYRAIRAGDVAGHRAWMIRTYALTFAAVTLRSWLGLLLGVQIPFAGPEPDIDALFVNAYAAVPFLCWVPNVVVAEWLIRRRGLPSYRITP